MWTRMSCCTCTGITLAAWSWGTFEMTQPQQMHSLSLCYKMHRVKTPLAQIHSSCSSCAATPAVKLAHIKNVSPGMILLTGHGKDTAPHCRSDLLPCVWEAAQHLLSCPASSLVLSQAHLLPWLTPAAVSWTGTASALSWSCWELLVQPCQCFLTVTFPKKTADVVPN